jgi:hypothetical protein
LIFFGGETVFTDNFGSNGGLLLRIGCHEFQSRNLYFLTAGSRAKPVPALEIVMAAITNGYGENRKANHRGRRGSGRA